MNPETPLSDVVGMDLYLLDFLLRGAIPEGAAILDSGCGHGRNLTYFMKNGYDACGSDRKAESIEVVRTKALALGVTEVEERFRVEASESLTFDDARFDLVISNAVLHFSRDDGHFEAIVDELHRVLKPGGLAFCRLCTDTGIVDRLAPDSRGIGGRWKRLPDGSDRYVASLDQLVEKTKRMGARLEGPIKTVNVQNLRCMTTWAWRK